MQKQSLQPESATWLLLLYALPARRNTERVNLWRKLKKFGAVALNTSGYVLPDDATQYERFQWLSKQIRDAGGEATLIRVAEIDGMSNAEMVGRFNEARAAEYKELAAACQEVLARHKMGAQDQLNAELEKFQRRFREIREVDYFNSPGVHDAQVVLERAAKAQAPQKGGAGTPKLETRAFVGKTWLTRPRPGIDRAGSAWLIRRFIDAKAKFIFGMDPAKHPKAAPFDMAEVELSHHGEDCTFETLVKRFGISDKAVHKMAEMVHDADLEDEKFQRSECIGINSVLSGWARTAITDDELLAKGIECFEGLYQSLRK
jgi:hypothetical protein